ncbi:MAG: bifunctional folylpolyglutamate synthase/dihydrofolate synthase [Candidatus Poseidoniaceae archaeon]
MDEARAWLEARRAFGMALGLDTTRRLLVALDRPDLRTSTVLHVAGSNGKGTLCAIMAAKAQDMGHTTVLFTSPHVARIEERVRVNGRPVSAERFDEALLRVKTCAEVLSVEPTYFETTMLVAWAVCDLVKADVMVQETGLGGRLDATRATRADLAVVTSVSVEHASLLGSTRSEIMVEKAAIARPGKPLLIRNPEDHLVLDAARHTAQRAGSYDLDEPGPASEVIVAPVPENTDVREEASHLAHAACQLLGWPTEGLEALATRIRWPARGQWVDDADSACGPLLIDAAHNPSGLERALPGLWTGFQDRIGAGAWRLLFGTSPQDDLAAMVAPLLERCRLSHPDHVMLVAPEGGRMPGVPPGELAELAWSSLNGVHTFQSVHDAVRHMQAAPMPTLVVGSLYLAGNVLAELGLDGDDDLSLLPSQG